MYTCKYIFLQYYTFTKYTRSFEQGFEIQTNITTQFGGFNHNCLIQHLGVVFVTKAEARDIVFQLKTTQPLYTLTLLELTTYIHYFRLSSFLAQPSLLLRPTMAMVDTAVDMVDTVDTDMAVDTAMDTTLARDPLMLSQKPPL